jgi:hypothetical protein
MNRWYLDNITTNFYGPTRLAILFNQSYINRFLRDFTDWLKTNSNLLTGGAPSLPSSEVVLNSPEGLNLTNGRIDYLFSSLPELSGALKNIGINPSNLTYKASSSEESSILAPYILGDMMSFANNWLIQNNLSLNVANRPQLVAAVIQRLQSNTTILNILQTNHPDIAPFFMSRTTPLGENLTNTYTLSTITAATSPTTNVDAFTNYKKFQGVYSTSKVLPTDYHPF